MNRIFTILIAVLLAASLWAQAPQSFSYQAVIRGANNELVVNKPVGMKISLLQGSENGNPIYVETHNSMANANGLVSIAIGAGAKVVGDFTAIDWSKGPYFIKTETDLTGGISYSLSSVSQLLSVPYAIHAKTAESIVGGNSGSFGHYIGEQYGGGVIFHVWKDKLGVEHGLVVNKTDLSISEAWSNVASVAIGEAARSSWDGLSNSNAIVNQQGHTSSAAKLCLDLVSEGQSDWYLPAIDELSLLYANIFDVNNTLASISGSKVFSNVKNDFDWAYWSSTEGIDDNGKPWNYNFYYGNKQDDSKSFQIYVRAIRRF
jgi:hypothetical protein